MILIITSIVTLLTIVVLANFYAKKCDLCSFNKSHVLCLRGILALLIVISHIALENFHMEIDNCAGEIIGYGKLAVDAFFACAGYGLLISYKNKGIAYFDGFLSRRLLRVFVPLLLCTIVFILMEILFLDKNVGVVFSGIGVGRTELPHSWFCYAIIYVYISYWLLFQICKRFSNEKYYILFFICGMICACTIYKIVLSKYLHWDRYWTNSIYAVNVGMLLCYYEDKIKYIARKMKLFRCFIPIFLCLCLCLIWKYCIAYYDLLCCLIVPLMALFMVYINMIAKNKITEFLGKYAYEIYLTHGIFLIWYSSLRLHPIVWICLIYAASILSAIMLSYICDKIIQSINCNNVL